MTINRKELKTDYICNGENWLEVTGKKRVKNWLKGRSVCTWGAGKLGETGFYKLAQFSPEHLGDKTRIYYCRLSIVESIERH